MMISQLKTSLKSRFPYFASFLRNFYSHFVTKQSATQIFTKIYNQNLWGDANSYSGRGSNLEQTKTIRYSLPLLIQELNATVLLDIPCGDFYWMKMIDADFYYIGGDIVKDLIDQNKKLYADEKRRFVHVDIMRDQLPKADIVLCRDCFVHFSYFHVFSSLRNLKKTGSTYILTTTFVSQSRNSDISTGSWRPINLQLPPFNFPEPLRIINEGHPNLEYEDKSLGLWKVADIPDY